MNHPATGLSFMAPTSCNSRIVWLEYGNLFPEIFPRQIMTERGSNLLHNLDYYCGIPLSLLTSVFRKSSSLARRPAPDLSNSSRIGIICLGAIGDMLLLSGLVNGIHASYPHARIDIIASYSNAPAARLLPAIQGCHAFSVTRVDHIIRFVRRQKYNYLIDSSQWARLGNIICNMSGAGCTIGFATAGQYRASGYDIRVFHNPAVHEIDNFQALGRALIPNFCGECALYLPHVGTSRKNVSDKKEIYCHMWPGGKKSWLKQWPAEHWQNLIEMLLAAGYHVILTGSPENCVDTEDFLQKYFYGRKNITSLAGKISLVDLAMRLSTCSALISVNTGIMHLGALAGAPVVALNGPTNPARWGAVGKKTVNLQPRQGEHAYLNLGFEYPDKAENNMHGLPVEDVVKALRRIKDTGCL